MNIDAILAKHLISKQFPQWKDLVVTPVAIGGWDNRTFHLGDHMVVRMPSVQQYAAKVAKEQYWLPKLASLLPLEIPTPIAMGQPDEHYPWDWSIYRWIQGDTVAAVPLADKNQLAIDLAAFIKALHAIDLSNGPIPEYGDFSYNGGLEAYNDETRRAVLILAAKIDVKTALELWEHALTSQWRQDPVWVHGDLSTGNMLMKNGRLNAIIDFSGLSVGDPACDLVIAWKFFNHDTRKIFRQLLPLDEDTWARSRAWALWKSLFIAASIGESNPIEAAQAWYTIHETLDDYNHERGLKMISSNR